MNIAEIAKMAGVSKAAVSRYFNDGYISEEKKEAISKVVEETGYRPSLQAQMLRTKKTKMIGVIAPKAASSSMGSIVEGILSELNKNDYQMILAVTQNNPQKELVYLNAFDQKQVDGVILIGTIFSPEHKKVLRNMKVPVVVVGQRFHGYCSVYHDDYHAMYDLTKKVIEKGKKNLGYLGVFMQDKAAGEERYRGFKDAAKEYLGKEGQEHFLISKFSVQSGYENAKKLCENYEELDGVICATDEIAVGAMQYLLEQKIQIPEQVYIAGLGDSTLAKIAGHSMMTVHYSYEKSGSIAAKMMIDILKTGKSELKEIMLGYTIVEEKR